MPLLYKDRVKEVASNKPNASTAFNLPDSAPAGFQSFDAAYATGETMECMATNGAAWESFIGTFTAGTPDTLARTTLLASSTGSAIDWSSGGDVTVFVTPSARAIDRLQNPGCVIVRNDGTTNQSIANATFTKVAAALATETLDQNGWWDHTNKRLQPNIPGVYLVAAGIQLSAVADGTSVIPIARLNGADYAHLARGYAARTSPSPNLGASGSALVSMNGSSDYVEFFVYQDGGASYNTLTGGERVFFMAFRVGD